MKKSGFTLIEVIVSLSILTILFTVGVSLSKFGNNLSSDIESEGYIYEIQNLLSYGKSFCKEKNIDGKFDYSREINEFKFMIGRDEVKKNIKLPENIELINGFRICVKPNGKITTGKTLMIEDEWKEKVDITIRVGVDLIVIKEEDIK